MRFDWDDQKSNWLKEHRGYSLEEASQVFSGRFVERMKRDDPLQWAAVGFVGTRLLTVIYEVRRDKEGEYYWLVTYWKASREERSLYETSI